jgi:hypothetical protein
MIKYSGMLFFKLWSEKLNLNIECEDKWNKSDVLFTYIISFVIWNLICWYALLAAVFFWYKRLKMQYVLFVILISQMI